VSRRHCFIQGGAYYRTNFSLAYFHKFDLEYMDNAIVFGRDYLYDLVAEQIQREKNLK
jgi:hypothetical protein